MSSLNLSVLEGQLAVEFKVTKIRIQYAHKGNYKMCLTVFNGYGYRMYFGILQELTEDGIRNILNNNLISSN